MKAEELMIGDWVCLADGNLPLEERYFKIEYLAISAGVSWVNQGTNAPIGLGDDESCIPVFRDEIYPIPLTPEILEKNGFGCDRNDGYAILRLENNSELLYYFHEYKLTNFYKSEIIFRCQCVYAHELQHALKLCGIDKEIVV